MMLAPDFTGSRRSWTNKQGHSGQS